MVKIRALRQYNFGVLEKKGKMYFLIEGQEVNMPDREPYLEAVSVAVDGGFVELVNAPKENSPISSVLKKVTPKKEDKPKEEKKAPVKESKKE